MPTLVVSDLGAHVAPDLGGAPWTCSEGVLMVDGAHVTALATTLGAAGSLRLAAAWAVCSLVVSIVVGFLLHAGHGSTQDVSAPEPGWDGPGLTGPNRRSAGP
ncbi:MAG: hypothetical protein ACRDYW_09995 [Acidimicrobiales bacterium]